MKKGQYVSRSVYQKVCEENKKLKADLKIVCFSGIIDHAKTIEVMDRWDDYFKQKQEFNDMLIAYAKQYLKDHPEYDIMSPKFQPLQKP